MCAIQRVFWPFQPLPPLLCILGIFFPATRGRESPKEYEAALLLALSQRGTQMGERHFIPSVKSVLGCGEVWNRGWAISSKQQQINIIAVARDHVASVRGTGGPQNLSVILELCLHLFADSQLVECRNSKLDKYSIFMLTFSKPVSYMRNGWTLSTASPL